MAAYARQGRHGSARRESASGDGLWFFTAIARIRPRSAAGNASGSRKARIAMYCAVHGPMPGSAQQLRHGLVEVDRRDEQPRRPRRPPRRARSASRRARRVRPMPVRSAFASVAGVGKIRVGASPSRARPSAFRAVRPIAATRRPANGRRRSHAHLLAEHGAHRELERVPRARHAHTRARARRRRASRGSRARCSSMAAMSASRSKRRRRRATMSPSALHVARRDGRRASAILAADRPDLDDARRAAEARTCGVLLARHALHARNRTQCEEFEHARASRTARLNGSLERRPSART